MGVPGIDPINLGIGAAYFGMNMYRRRSRGVKRRRGGVISGVFDGKFRGPRDRARNAILRSGYSETHIQTGTVEQDGVAYLGIASYPAFKGGTQAQYGRVFEDIWIAILRKFFRHYHPGRFEFNSPDQDFDQLVDYGVDAGLGIPVSYNREAIQLIFAKPDGTSTTSPVGVGATDENRFYYFNPLVGYSATYSTLRTLADAIAARCMKVYVEDGLVPLMMKNMTSIMTYNTTNPNDQYANITNATMWLNNCRVSAYVKTVMTVQNQTIADDTTEGNGFRNAMTDISCNPIRGKLYYFSDLGPKLRAGYDLGSSSATTISDDEWFAYYYNKPNDNALVGGQLRNIYIAQEGDPVDNVNPTGCWVTIPPRAYFSNCKSAVNVTLDPGHMKTFTLTFRFKGSLHNFIKGERLDIDNQDTYENGDIENEVRSAGYAKGMGKSCILAMEKRLRSGTAGVQLQWQVNTHISTNCSIRSKQYMTKDVTTNGV